MHPFFCLSWSEEQIINQKGLVPKMGGTDSQIQESFFFFFETSFIYF